MILLTAVGWLGLPQWLRDKAMSEMQEMQVRSLGWEDPLEKGMAIHSSILGRRLSWTKEAGGYRPWGCKESDTT